MLHKANCALELFRTEKLSIWLSVEAYKYFDGIVSFTGNKFYYGIEITELLTSVVT